MKFEAPPADILGARGGFSTPRAQFINNEFGLGEFLAKGICFAKYDVDLAKSVALEKPEKASCVD